MHFTDGETEGGLECDLHIIYHQLYARNWGYYSMREGGNGSPFLVIKWGDDTSWIVWDSPCMPTDPAIAPSCSLKCHDLDNTYKPHCIVGETEIHQRIAQVN